jgi:hypothetical protein
MTFTRIWRLQHRKMEVPVYLGAFAFSFAHLEFQGMRVMAWKTLSKQVMLIETPLPTL